LLGPKEQVRFFHAFLSISRPNHFPSENTYNIDINNPAAVMASSATSHPLAAYLIRLMKAKSSNLCVSADITSAASMLSLARAVGPAIVVFKTHADILAGWDSDPVTGTGAQLAAIAHEHGFLIFEDRKFADIASTCQLQFVGGVHRIVEWAHIINTHIISGPDVVRALHASALAWKEDGGGLLRTGPAYAGIEEPPSEKGVLLLAQMSSAGNFLDDAYTAACVGIARQNKNFVIGFIAQENLNSEPVDAFITMTPGCSLPPSESLDDSEFVPGAEDALGQQYNTPRSIIEKGNDIIIVGRGICNAQDPASKAEQYRKAAWEAYVGRS
jgi:uridine monophosphate synthetase